MHNPEHLQENETHRFLKDSEIQMEHLISARRPFLVIINNKNITCQIMGFAVPAGRKVRLKEDKKKD